MLKPVPPQTAMFARATYRPVPPRAGPAAGRPSWSQDVVEGADAGQVEEAPEQRGDHAGDGVGQEDREPGERREPGAVGVQQQREQQRQAEHHRHHDAAVAEDPQRAVRAVRVGAGRRCSCSRPAHTSCGRPRPGPSPETLTLRRLRQTAYPMGSAKNRREQQRGRREEQVRRAACPERRGMRDSFRRAGPRRRATACRRVRAVVSSVTLKPCFFMSSTVVCCMVASAAVKSDLVLGGGAEGVVEGAVGDVDVRAPGDGRPSSRRSSRPSV